MDSTLFNWLKDTFTTLWDVFKIQIPGTNFTFAALGAAALLVDVSLRIINYISGFGFGGVSGIGRMMKSVDEVRGGNNKKIVGKAKENKSYTSSTWGE